MLIDWFTVVAQIINFLVLVWALKHFLYKHVIAAIDAREKFIATTLADAKSKKTEAEKAREEFEQKNENFENQRQQLLDKTHEEAKVLRQQILSEAQSSADAIRLHRQKALESEEHHLHHSLRLRIQKEVFAIAQKMVKDLSGAGLEERIVEVFKQRLSQLNSREKENLISSMTDPPAALEVRSAFDLRKDQWESIDEVIKEIFGQEIPIHFKVSPELICGIELSANGTKLAWSVADYLTSLKNEIDKLLKSSASLPSFAKDTKSTDSETKPRSLEIGI